MMELTTTNNLAGLQSSDFDKIIKGKQVKLFLLKNAKGAQACVTNFGGIIASLHVPDKNGKFVDVFLGHKSIDNYLSSPEGFLCTLVGRYANRIKKSQFVLDGKTYKLTPTNEHYTLHGATNGFHNVVWDAKQIDDQTLQLKYLSPDGDEGFPGELSVEVIYKLTNDNELSVSYAATTSSPTVINLTQHAYINLSGEGSGDVMQHEMVINADFFTPTDCNSTPTGEVLKVAGTPMDFTTSHTLGERINEPFEQLTFGKGYDHGYILNKQEAGKLTFAASAYSPLSGIRLSLYTTEPSVQLYTANWLNGFEGKKGHRYPERTAFCLETQHPADAPNNHHFPSTILRPGEVYTQLTILKFDTK